jgi:small subunit ribosomal protein S6
VRSYELLFIVSPDVEGDELSAVVDTVEGLVKRIDGTVTRVDPWGLRRLAYPIQGQWEGQYVLMLLELEPQSASELERSLKLNELVMRYLIVRVD